MNAAVLASTLTQPSTALLAAVPALAGAPAAGMTMTAANCVAVTAALLQAACQRGQLEDASAAARIAMALAPPDSPHQAMLRVLAEANPALMQAPDEHRLYLLRGADGSALGLLRLRDSGRVSAADGLPATHWSLKDGNLDLATDHGVAHTRFVLCGEQAGMRLYLGESLADGEPRLLQELNCTYTRLRLLDPEMTGPFCGLYDAQAMVPADLPERAVLLLSSPHNGADALAAALNQHAALHLDGELLHPQAIVLADGPLTVTEAGTLHSLRAKDPAWFARMMLGRSHDRSGRDLGAVAVRGFTLSAIHSQPVLDWALAETALRIVLVARSNLLAEYADLLADHAGIDPGAPQIFEAERFRRFVDMKQRHLQALRGRLMQRNADSVEVDASRLNPATMAELCAFLTDQTVLPVEQVDGVVLSVSPVIERFDNPVEVAECLAALGHPEWAGLEGSAWVPAA